MLQMKSAGRKRSLVIKLRLDRPSAKESAIERLDCLPGSDKTGKCNKDPYGLVFWHINWHLMYEAVLQDAMLASFLG